MELDDLLDSVGKIPDLDDMWRRSGAVFEERRSALSILENHLSRGLNGLNDLVDQAIGELRGVPGYDHVRSFTSVEKPPDFRAWTSTMQSDPTTAEITSFWKVESLYTLVEPISITIDGVSKALTAIKKMSVVRARSRESSWSVEQNHRAMLEDLQKQGTNILTIFERHLDPAMSSLRRICDTLRLERDELGVDEVRAFEAADDDERLCIVTPIWEQVAKFQDVKLWEQSWHADSLGRLRMYFRLAMASDVIDVCSKMEAKVATQRAQFHVPSLGNI